MPSGESATSWNKLRAARHSRAVPSNLSRRQVMVAALPLPGILAAQTRRAPTPTMNTRLYTFAAGNAGAWSITSIKPVTGDTLALAPKLAVLEGGPPATPERSVWALHGVTSNVRYATRSERESLTAKQVAPGRPAATRAALIPIRKSAPWWDLTQDERRRIFEDASHHTQTGLRYLPAIARRLHHRRDLATAELFDFLTWFDYAPTDAQAFEDLVGLLRATEEWKYVEREVDIRLARSIG